MCVCERERESVCVCVCVCVALCVECNVVNVFLLFVALGPNVGTSFIVNRV